LLAVEGGGLRIVAGGRKKRSYNPPPQGMKGSRA